jgi:integrase
MAWHERAPSGIYFIQFRLGGQKFRRSLKTKIEKEADTAVSRVAENLGLVHRGLMDIPDTADVISFLLSNARVHNQPLPVRVTLKGLFDKYFAAVPEGNLEETTIYGMEIHQNTLQKFFGVNFPIRTLELSNLQEYVEERSQADGVNGKLSPATIKKEIVTLRTVWNWARQNKLVSGPFPSRGLKYPKGKEKLPFMQFSDVVRLAKAHPDQAVEFWECCYLTKENLAELLAYVKKNARHPFIYPLFCTVAFTGARRSEMARAKTTDIENGFITIHERKKCHSKKTTRRVPLTPFLAKVLKDWLKNHPGEFLFCHKTAVERSKTRREVFVSQLTRDELHDHFKRTLAGSKWESLRGFHVLRHSFVSILASDGVDQRLIDEWAGHTTDEQRRRYRHLRPEPLKKTIEAVFAF